MTLARGDKLVKLGPDGQALTTEQQTYIEWEVKDLGQHLTVNFGETEGGFETAIIVLLKKLH